MSAFEPADANFAARVRDDFARQGIMAHIGARLMRVEAGLVEIMLPYRDELSQQHGYFHAGVTSTIADSAGGYAGYTLIPADSTMLTVEFKVNLLAPAVGEKLVAVGRVVKPGRTLTVCEFDVTVVRVGVSSPCARGMQTMIRLDQRPNRQSA